MAPEKLLQTAAKHVLIANPAGHLYGVEVLEQRLGVLTARRELVAKTRDRDRTIPVAERNHGPPHLLEGLRGVIDARLQARELPRERESLARLADPPGSYVERL